MREYRVIRAIDAGGMGRVFEAEAEFGLGLCKRVAIKLIRPDRNDNIHRALFANEASTSLDINHDHPNLVTVFDFGQTEAGEPFMVMEFIDGSTVRELHKLGRIDLPVVRRIALCALQGLKFLHKHGVLHRDVAPRNVLIGRSGCVKLTDLGLVKRMSGSRSVMFCGTPQYGPPEAILHDQTRTTASDLYSLGAVLYELATGELPYGSDDIGEIKQAMKRGDDPAPRLTELPDDLARLIAGLIHTEPEQRPTVTEAIGQIDTSEQAMASEQAVGALVDLRAPKSDASSQGTLFSIRGAVLRDADPAGEDPLQRRRLKPAPPRRGPWWPWVVAMLVGVALGVLVTSTALRDDVAPMERAPAQADESAIGAETGAARGAEIEAETSAETGAETDAEMAPAGALELRSTEEEAQPGGATPQ